MTTRTLTVCTLRMLVPLCLLVCLTDSLSAQRRRRPVKPIKVVKIDRKTPVSYSKDIEPILFNKCAFCHRGNVTKGGFDMATYEALMEGGRRGKPVVPGNAAKSLLYLASGKTKKPFMPPRSEEALTPEELALIKLWIDQGAKAPKGASITRTVNLTPPPATVKATYGVAVSPDKTAVAASRGNQIHIYDGKTGNYVRTLKDPELKTIDKRPLEAAHLSLVESLAYSPDGKYLASGSYREVILWDAQTGMIVGRLKDFSDRVVALDFSKDGKKLATGGGPPTEDGEIKVFEVPSGKLVQDIKEGHSDTVFGVCFSPDGTKLATCGADKFVKTFEVATGKFIKSFEGHTHHVLAVGWKGDGKRLASAGADNVVKIWDFEKGEQIRTVNAASKQLTRLVFFGSKGDQFVTCSGDQRVRSWSVDNGRNTRNFQSAGCFLYALDVSPDGELVAAGGEDGMVYIYEGKRGRLIKASQPPEAAGTAEKAAKK